MQFRKIARENNEEKARVGMQGIISNQSQYPQRTPYRVTSSTPSLAPRAIEARRRHRGRAHAHRLRDPSARHRFRPPRHARPAAATATRRSPPPSRRSKRRIRTSPAVRLLPQRHRCAAGPHRARPRGDEDARHAVLHRERGQHRQAAARRRALRGRSRRASAHAGRRPEFQGHRPDHGGARTRTTTSRFACSIRSAARSRVSPGARRTSSRRSAISRAGCTTSR